MEQQRRGRIGNLPANINIMNPVPNKDAKSITGLVRKNGRIAGYEPSDGRVPSKQEGVALAKQGGIRGVAIASRNGTEYLRSLPDGDESDNLGDLPGARADPGPARTNTRPATGAVVFPSPSRGCYFLRTKAFLGMRHTGQVQSAGSSSKPKLGSLYT